jgi:Dit-like phage tail protein
MSLQTLIATINPIAITLVKKFLSQPIVGLVPIEATRFDCIMEAEVSRHVLINLQQGLQNVMDNVAPGPRTWEIEGYIGGFPVELSSQYMPSLFLMTTALDGIFNSRQTTTLVDPSSRLYQVMISRFQYSHDPAVANRVPIRLSLVEITILKAEIGTQASTPVDQVNSSSTPGKTGGAPASYGSTPSNAAAVPDAIPGVTRPGP